MKLSPKITRVRRKKNFISLRMSIVNYYRDFAGRPRHKIVAAFPTVRSTMTNDRITQLSFWRKVNGACLRLLEKEGAMAQDIRTIKRTFSEIVPFPAAASVPVAQSANSEMAEAKKNPLAERFPILAK